MPADVLTASLYARFRSRQQHTFAEKVLSAMRLGFGGHVEARNEEITEEDAMRVGAFYFPTDYGIDIAELARALEDRGFDSLFVCEHTHIPASRKYARSRAAASCPSATRTPTIRSWRCRSPRRPPRS